ncbi:MAG: tRNA (adenine(22)-N(1))-methyltransferase TrmK [Myxococcales bacterium]
MATSDALMKVRYGNLSVSYDANLDGGGMTFGQLYLDYLRERVGKVGHAFEYCAGPGFIGFSLLAHGLCDRLTLADINPAAVAACERTIRENGLQDRVKVYLSDGLAGIPDSERWDLVVSNPPHWRGTHQQWENELRLIDPDFIVHRKLYEGVGRFLAPGGRVVIQENGLGTRPSDFETMIAGGGLRVVEVFPDDGLKSPLLHHLRSRAVLLVERVLNTEAAEAVFKKGRLFRQNRETPRREIKPYYFIWTERAA